MKGMNELSINPIISFSPFFEVAGLLLVDPSRSFIGFKYQTWTNLNISVACI